MISRILQPKDSRAIAQDMNKKPFSMFELEDKFKIKHAIGITIMTYEDYIKARNKISEKSNL